MSLLLGPLSIKATVAVNLLLGSWSNYQVPVETYRDTFTPEVAPIAAPGFPTQFSGFRTFYSGAVKELCIVAEADANTGMGGVLKIDKNGTKYAVYLVETTDPDASHVYIRTSTGTKAIRLKT